MQIDVDPVRRGGRPVRATTGAMVAGGRRTQAHAERRGTDILRGAAEPIARAVDGSSASLRGRGKTFAPAAPRVTLLDAELAPVTWPRRDAEDVRAWIEKMLGTGAGDGRHEASVVAGTGAARSLKGGDVVLTAGGDVAPSFPAMERAVANASREYSTRRKTKTKIKRGGGEKSLNEDDRTSGGPAPPPVLAVKVLRSGEIVDVDVELSEASCAGTARLLHWGGCCLQSTHRPVAELGFVPTEEEGGGGEGGGGGGGDGNARPLDVFISRWYHGSPAQRYGLYALHWVRSVNGVPTPTLDARRRDAAGGGRRVRESRASVAHGKAEGGQREDGPALLADVGAQEERGRKRRVGTRRDRVRSGIGRRAPFVSARRRASYDFLEST